MRKLINIKYKLDINQILATEIKRAGGGGGEWRPPNRNSYMSFMPLYFSKHETIKETVLNNNA